MIFDHGLEIQTSMDYLKILASVIFVILVIGIQTTDLPVLFAFGLLALLLYILGRNYRTYLVTIIVFGLGFFVFLYLTKNITSHIEADQTRIIINRLLLLLPIIPLVVLSFVQRVPMLRFGWHPQWKEGIKFPFLWYGFHSTRVWVFLLIAMGVNVLVFLPLIIQKDLSWLQSIFMFALLFSLVNSFLEEFIWRGILLSRFTEQLGEKWAVALTSLGFGLQHYSLGFSWGVSLLFAIGGFFFAGVTVKSRSITPALIWHFILNMLMVLGGVILN